MVRTEQVKLIIFFSLFSDNEEIKCEQNINFKELKKNPIVEAFDKLLDEVYDKNLGD